MKKNFLYLLVLVFACFLRGANAQTYVASTPAHAIVRNFLQISPTDSIDFIRWNLEIGQGVFKLQCRYGLSQPSTPGFSNEKRVAFEGQLTKSGYYYNLQHRGRNISILELNQNVLHFVDSDKGMLIGNGGYSYALNNDYPLESNSFNFRAELTKTTGPLVFEGRTPCQELSALLGLNKSDACNKMKWYMLFYTNQVTGRPSHFLMGGIGYKKETMSKGTWKIVTGQDGRIIYQLTSDNWSRPLNLLKADDNILFFLDGNVRMFTGNEDFSYTLNRREKEYPRSDR